MVGNPWIQFSVLLLSLFCMISKHPNKHQDLKPSTEKKIHDWLDTVAHANTEGGGGTSHERHNKDDLHLKSIYKCTSSPLSNHRTMTFSSLAHCNQDLYLTFTGQINHRLHSKKQEREWYSSTVNIRELKLHTTVTLSLIFTLIIGIRAA